MVRIALSCTDSIVPQLGASVDTLRAVSALLAATPITVGDLADELEG